MSAYGLPASYDSWRTAYPPHWDGPGSCPRCENPADDCCCDPCKTCDEQPTNCECDPDEEPAADEAPPVIEPAAAERRDASWLAGYDDGWREADGRKPKAPWPPADGDAYTAGHKAGLHARKNPPPIDPLGLINAPGATP